MPRFLIQRKFGQRDEAEMGAIGRDSKRIIEEHYPDVVWEISHVVSDDAGEITTFCIYTAPNEDRKDAAKTATKLTSPIPIMSAAAVTLILLSSTWGTILSRCAS